MKLQNDQQSQLARGLEYLAQICNEADLKDGKQTSTSRLRKLAESDPIQLVANQWPSLVSPVHGILLDHFQRDIIRSAFDAEVAEIFIKGCTKAGKGTAVALVCCLWFRIFPHSRIVITSQRYAHARDNLFGEVLMWRKRMVDAGPGANQRANIRDHERHYVEIGNTEAGEGFSGHHGPATLFVFDEASSISTEFYELAKTQARLIVALSNPRTLSGWFRRGFPTENPDEDQTVEAPMGKRRCITVDGAELMNVKAGRSIIPNQLTKERFAGLCASSDKRWVDCFARGRFPKEDVDLQLILNSWLERAADGFDPAVIEVTAFGLDVAASFTGDQSALAPGGPGGCRALHRWRHRDTMQTVGHVVRVASDAYGVDLTRGDVPVTVDMDGVGVGVGNRLAELGVRVIEFRGNQSADDKSRYRNRRAEAYGELARRLNPDSEYTDVWRIPVNPMLWEELCAPEKIYDSDGIRFRLTPKDRTTRQGEESIKDKIGRSPDAADALVYLHWAVMELAVDNKPKAVANQFSPSSLPDDVRDKLPVIERYRSFSR